MNIGYSDLRVQSSLRDEELETPELGKEVSGYWEVNEFKILLKYETIKGSLLTFDTWHEVWVQLDGEEVYGVAYRWHEGFVVQRYVVDGRCFEFKPYVYYPDWRSDDPDNDSDLEFGLYREQLDDHIFEYLPTESETKDEYLCRLRSAAGNDGVKEIQSA